jgi:hypothetical protein
MPFSTGKTGLGAAKRTGGKGTRGENKAIDKSIPSLRMFLPASDKRSGNTNSGKEKSV